MSFVFLVAGTLLGLVLGVAFEVGLFGAVVGSACGWLLGRVRELEARVRRLEQPVPTRVVRAPPGVEERVPAVTPPAPGAAEPPSTGWAPPIPAAPAAASIPAELEPTIGPPTDGAAAALPGSAGLEAARAWLRRWFAEGNVPAKVGVLVLFAGVAALLRYASEEGWLSLPIALRLSAVGVAGTGALIFGVRERDRRRVFALSLQGGAIGILLLTNFAAFRLYDLLPASLAFAIVAVLVAASGTLALVQNAQILAVLGSLGGFLAPILLSTGSGNHVALFGWYALLNALIFATAFFRPWRLLQLVGFTSTFGVASVWGTLQYEPADFWSTEPFLVFFFLCFATMPLLQGGTRSRGQALADGALVFGTPVAALGVQTVLLDDAMLPMALSALAIAVVELVLARAVWRRPEMRVVAESYGALALAFATLAVPLALSARGAAAVFSVEGAALVWLGLRQGRRLSHLAGVGLLLVASLVNLAFPAGGEPFVLNGAFASTLLLSLAAGTAALAWWKLRANGLVASALLLLATWWWLFAGVREVTEHFSLAPEVDGFVLFLAGTALLQAAIARRLQAVTAAWIAATCLVVLVPIALVQLDMRPQPLGGMGALVWALFVALAAGTLHLLRAAATGPLATAHVAALFALLITAGGSLHELGIDLGMAWRFAAAFLPFVVALILVWRRPALAALPVPDRFPAYRPVLIGLLASMLALVFAASLFTTPDTAPLPWLPLLSPLDLVRAAILFVGIGALQATGAPAPLRHILLGVGLLLAASATTLAGVHHLADVRWAPIAMGRSAHAQTSLSVVWSLLGVAGWVLGSRRGNRWLWRAGAALMAVVLIKLGLVDRSHLGNITGIVSFIAFGLLCTLVGYLAPAPPRNRETTP